MWSDGPSQASIKANSFSTARTCHTRMVLPAAGAGRQGCNFVVRWAGVSMHSACCCVICCLGSAPSKNHNQLYVRMKMNKASYRKPGKLSYPLPRNFVLERTSRATHCTDRAQTSTTVSGRPSSVEPLVVCANGACTKRYERKCIKKSQM